MKLLYVLRPKLFPAQRGQFAPSQCTLFTLSSQLTDTFSFSSFTIKERPKHSHPSPTPPPPHDHITHSHPPQEKKTNMGGESSMGALVPSLYSEATTSKMPPPTEELDKDILCPICMQIIKDAFLTSCGHSFCYMCITTHLRNKNDCPCCSHYLTNNRIFPNFLLNKVCSSIHSCSSLPIFIFIL